MALQTGHLNSYNGAVSAARTDHSVSPMFASVQAGDQLVMLVVYVCMRFLTEDNRSVFCIQLHLTYVSCVDMGAGMPNHGSLPASIKTHVMRGHKRLLHYCKKKS